MSLLPLRWRSALRLAVSCLSSAVLSWTFGEAPAPPPQPVPFSHRVHSATGAKCTDCHAMRDPGDRAGFPSETLCMGCHISVKKDSPEIARLAASAKARKPIEWVRIYKLPDYVWFSHQSHSRDAKVSCETCHGPVAERDVMTKEKPTSMASCMACHSRMKASNDCGFCHNPNP